MKDETKSGGSRIFAGFMSYLPIIQWVLTVVIAISVYALSQRDSMTVQAQEVKANAARITSLEAVVVANKEDRTKQIDQLRREVMTKELFEAYHRVDAERMDRIEKMLNSLLDGQTRRNGNY